MAHIEALDQNFASIGYVFFVGGQRRVDVYITLLQVIIMPCEKCAGITSMKAVAENSMKAPHLLLTTLAASPTIIFILSVACIEHTKCINTAAHHIILICNNRLSAAGSRNVNRLANQ